MTRIIQVVHVTWVDSEALGEWQALGGLTHKHEEIQTVGMLVHSDADTYLIASTYDGESDSINAAIWIPRACVRTVRPLGTVVINADG